MAIGVEPSLSRAPDRSPMSLVRPGALFAAVQPIVRLADGEVIGYEALARATDPTVEGAPDAWFARAAIEGWSPSLEAACLLAASSVGVPPEDRLLFVNVLPRHLASPQVLAMRDVLPARVVLELTEQEAIADVESVRADLEEWTGRGARVALDDVGAGYAGLQQVVHLQPEFLKLDRSLITGIDDDRVRQAMVASLLGFAGAVGTTIIAEGVETAAELRWLRDAGVPLAQGYHLARPGAPWPEPRRTTPVESRSAVLVAGDGIVRSSRLERTRSVSEACTVVAEELFALGEVMPSVYLESAGRLRCRAQRGLWQVLDGMRGDAGVTGRTFATGRAVHVPDVARDAGYLEAIPGVAAEYCTPIVAAGRTVGALNVESLAAIGPSMRATVDRYADALGHHLATLPGEQVVPMRRLGRTVGSLFTQRGPRATAQAILGAACELVGTDSGAVVSTGERTSMVAATGPLAPALERLGVEHLDHLVELLDPVTSCYSSGEATGLAFSGGEPLRAAGACAVVVLPLGAGDRRTGLLLLAHTGPLALGADVIEPAELLAAVAGSCLENAEHVAAVEHQARLDPLTGLPNHASFHEALRAAGTGRSFGVAMFDVDRFKQINDTRGHLFGDAVLAATAEAMSAHLPAGGSLYRVGGDEFAVLIPADGGRTAQDVVVAVEVLGEAARTVLRVHEAGISAGVAWHDPGTEPIETLRRADDALYAAKAAGGGVRRAAPPTSA
ncbi:MAG TPA: EAL domain-containing protein [Acidimicrobiales bacterium]